MGCIRIITSKLQPPKSNSASLRSIWLLYSRIILPLPPIIKKIFINMLMLQSFILKNCKKILDKYNDCIRFVSLFTGSMDKY